MLVAGTAGAATPHKPTAPKTLAHYDLNNNPVVEFVLPGNPHEVVIDVNDNGAPAITSWQQTNPIKKGGRQHIVAEFNMNGTTFIDFTAATNPNVLCVYSDGGNGVSAQMSTINCSAKTTAPTGTARTTTL